MKKLLVCFLACTLFVSAQALALRTTAKFCTEDVELVLYRGGAMSWYDGSNGTYVKGSYSLDWQTHYIQLFEEDGSLAFTGKFTGSSDMLNVYSITLAGNVLKPCR